MVIWKQFTRVERSWILYDWANSAYSTIMQAAILPVFFHGVATSGGLEDHVATAYWGYAVSAAAVVLALCAPVLGSIANYQGMKKRLFITAFTLGVFSTASAALQVHWPVLLAIYVLSFIGWGTSALIYDTCLFDVTTKDRMDKLSAYGFGFGYIGGSTIPFVASILLINLPDSSGISDSAAARISFLLAAVWWGLFTIPFLRDVKQRYSIPRVGGAARIVADSFRQIWKTLCSIRQYPYIFVFLLSYFFYIDGVNTVINMATVYGTEKGMDASMMVVILLVLQIVAFPFSLLYGYLAKRVGASRMILTGIVTYCGISVFGFFLEKAWHFWVLAFMVGTAQGGIQALSRSYFMKMVPQDKVNSYFGFYEIFGKFAAILGPAMMGAIGQASGDSKYGIISLIFLFIVGGGLFLRARKTCDLHQADVAA